MSQQSVNSVHYVCLNSRVTMYLALFFTISLMRLIGVSSDDLKPPNNSIVCPERHSCKNSTLDNDERYCRCDSLCKVYDDCCDDYVERLDTSENKLRINLSHDVIRCKQLEFYHYFKFHYIVDRCPKEFERGFVNSKCRARNFSSENTLVRVPVIGRQSTILYRNFYCATCNGEQDVVFWKGKAEFFEYDRYIGKAEITKENIKFLPPDDYIIRSCFNAIRTCQPNYRNGKVKKRCTKASSSNSFVKSLATEQSTNPIYYRNVDCAKCNFVNESRQMCQDHFVNVPHHGYHTAAFSYLIDFGLGNANSVEIVGDAGPNVTKPRSNVPCNKNQMYDSEAKICLTARCLPGKKLTSKGCKPK